MTTPNKITGKDQIIDLSDSSPENTQNMDTPKGSPFLPKISSKLSLSKKPSVYDNTMKEFRSRIFI